MQIQAWQLIVGTIAGFITAFLAEPVKVYFSGLAARRHLRAALYREMAHLYTGWKGLLELIDRGLVRPDQLSVNIPIVTHADCYLYAKSRPVEYFALREAAIIDAVYKNFLLVGSESLREPAERLQYARQAMTVFEGCVRRKEISSDLLLKLADTKQREMLREVLRKPAA